MNAFLKAIENLENAQAHDDALIHDLLQSGCEHYSVLFGVISLIKGDQYHVVHAEASMANFKPGDSFTYKDTFCELLVNTGKAQYFKASGQGGLKTHPCYRAFGLETYIGVPLKKSNEEKISGILDFSSPAGRFENFSDEDIQLIERAGAAVAKHLSEFQ